MTPAETELQVTTSMVRQLQRSATETANLSAGYRADGHTVTADYLAAVARRFGQLAERAPAVFADCDRRDALAANAAQDPESEACHVH